MLNLFDDSRHLFVGGTPPEFQMPVALQQRQFVGDFDKLRVNGELVGFWNSEKAHGISGAEMRQLPDAERNAESGVTFNGKGYMQMDVGGWNPRKKTSIMLSFMTYSPDVNTMDFEFPSRRDFDWQAFSSLWAKTVTSWCWSWLAAD